MSSVPDSALLSNIQTPFVALRRNVVAPESEFDRRQSDLLVDFVESVCEAVCAGPADPYEHIEGVHECTAAFRIVSEDGAILCEVPLNNLYQEVHRELLVLVSVLTPGSHDVSDEAEHAGGVNGDELFERFEHGVRGMRVPNVCKHDEKGPCLAIELLGRKHDAFVVRVLERARGKVQAHREFVRTTHEEIMLLLCSGRCLVVLVF
jgi:hypothetical protein